MCATLQFILDLVAFVNYQVPLLIEFQFVMQVLWLSETHRSFLTYLSPHCMSNFFVSVFVSLYQ
jgi:hypothetical protein